MAKKLRGVVFYEGPSMIDGSPIVGIATFSTSNDKTGRLVQTWILRSDMRPMEAINTGADESICGNCPLRGEIRPATERIKPSKETTETTNKGRSCYVLVYTAPTQVYTSYKAGTYPALSARLHAKKCAGRGLRYGSYGDPVAIPVRAWNRLHRLCTGRSQPGYTHQWRDERFQGWRKRLMASTHGREETLLAWSMGWRTFRTGDDVMEREVICPASEAGGYKSTCEKCGLCNGKADSHDNRKSIVIPAHGSGGKVQRIQRITQEREGLFSLPMA